MNTISQVSAFIENRPGMLREILGLLSEEEAVELKEHIGL